MPSNQLLPINASDPTVCVVLDDVHQQAQGLENHDFPSHGGRDFADMGVMVDTSTIDIQNYLIRYALSIGLSKSIMYLLF